MAKFSDKFFSKVADIENADHRLLSVLQFQQILEHQP